MLDRATLDISNPQITNGENVAQFTLNVPSNIGEEVYLQGVGKPRELTTFWQKFRVLP